MVFPDVVVPGIEQQCRDFGVQLIGTEVWLLQTDEEYPGIYGCLLEGILENRRTRARSKRLKCAYTNNLDIPTSNYENHEVFFRNGSRWDPLARVNDVLRVNQRVWAMVTLNANEREEYTCAGPVAMVPGVIRFIKGDEFVLICEKREGLRFQDGEVFSRNQLRPRLYIQGDGDIGAEANVVSRLYKEGNIDLAAVDRSILSLTSPPRRLRLTKSDPNENGKDADADHVGRPPRLRSSSPFAEEEMDESSEAAGTKRHRSDAHVVNVTAAKLTVAAAAASTTLDVYTNYGTLGTLDVNEHEQYWDDNWVDFVYNQ